MVTIVRKILHDVSLKFDLDMSARKVHTVNYGLIHIS